VSLWFSVSTKSVDFYKATNMKTITNVPRNREKRAASLLKLFALLGVMISLWLSSAAQGVSPRPDGLYFGANTAEGGAGALSSLTSGTNNSGF
jgi:hypothetical protein